MEQQLASVRGLLQANVESFLLVMGLPTMLYVGYNVSRSSFEKLDIDSPDATASPFKVRQGCWFCHCAIMMKLTGDTVLLCRRRSSQHGC